MSLPLLTTDGYPGRDVEPWASCAAPRCAPSIWDRTSSRGLRNLVGGEVKEYASLLAGAREQAVDRMAAEARALGADAVVAVRFETSTIAQMASEVLCYGTAVRLR